MSDKTKLVSQVGKYTIKIIQSKCIAAASCVAITPNVFKLNEENLAEMVDNPQDSEENIMLSAQSCPTGAIEIYESDPSANSGLGKRVWPPLE